MHDQITMLDPTAELSPVVRQPIARPDSLEGLTIGLLDISKSRGDVVLNRLEAKLNDRGLTTKRYMKPTFSRPAPDALQQQIATECDVVIEALAD